MKYFLGHLVAAQSLYIHGADARFLRGKQHFLSGLARELERESMKDLRSRRSFCDPGNGWEKEWADEFDGNELDRTSWEPISSHGHSHDAPVDGLNVTACRSGHCRPENVKVANGKLTIKSERSAEDASLYYTGAVTSKGHRAWKDNEPYRMCISAKLPGSVINSQGVWPAIWMLPDNGISDKCLDEGEVDILEMVNGDGKVYGTYHWMSSWPKQTCGDFDTFHKSVASESHPLSWENRFHEYAIERSSDHISFVIDGDVVQTVTADEFEGRTLSHSPFFLILNTAIGGGWPGEPTISTEMPIEHSIDYVRVARKSSKDTSFVQVEPEAGPECLYINLATRLDRKASMEVQLAETGLKCQRMDAVSMDAAKISGREACRRSHLKALAEIEASNAPYGIVLEDDAVWNQDPAVVNDILSRVKESISKYPVILLACNGYGKPTDEPWMLAVQDCQTTSAYVIRKDYISTLRKVWETETTEAYPVDLAWKRLQIQDHWGMTQPKLMIQGASFSDIENRHVDYGVFHMQNGSNASLNQTI